jgi:hypothetical protein
MNNYAHEKPWIVENYKRLKQLANRGENKRQKIQDFMNQVVDAGKELGHPDFTILKERMHFVLPCESLHV